MIYRWGSEAEADEVTGGFKYFSQALISAVDYAATAMCLRPHTESPIELDLGARLAIDLGLKLDIEPHPDYWTLIPQWRTRNFRFDYALIRDTRVILIECDGHEFHSTPKQIERDRRKDAEAASYGWPVLRFTGSEIYREIAQCVDRVMAALDREQGA